MPYACMIIVMHELQRGGAQRALFQFFLQQLCATTSKKELLRPSLRDCQRNAAPALLAFCTLTQLGAPLLLPCFQARSMPLVPGLTSAGLSSRM